MTQDTDPQTAETNSFNVQKKDRGNLFERLAYSVGFAVVAYLALNLLIALSIAQFVLRAVDSDPNPELASFIRRLAAYLRAVILYFSLTSDDKPFPFGDFPKSGDAA
jgi:hypothetical protein